MRMIESATELQLRSALPRAMVFWLAITALVCVLYITRCLHDDVPPQDHVALAFILCFLLTQAWLKLEQNTLRIDLSFNRCWLYQHRFCFSRVQSLPVSQIHSARVENASHTLSRVVLVTSSGMIPLSEGYSRANSDVIETTEHINRFLQSQCQFLPA